MSKLCGKNISTCTTTDSVTPITCPKSNLSDQNSKNTPDITTMSPDSTPVPISADSCFQSEHPHWPYKVQPTHIATATTCTSYISHGAR
jgi:hypothetical protein